MSPDNRERYLKNGMDHLSKTSGETPSVSEEEISDVIKNSNPPDANDGDIEVEKKDVKGAAGTLTNAVDRMVPPIIMAIGMMEATLKWIKILVTVSYTHLTLPTSDLV